MNLITWIKRKAYDVFIILFGDSIVANLFTKQIETDNV